jgi:hypothetical protein
MTTVEFGNALLGKLYDPCNIGMNGPVAADVRMEPWAVPVSFLTDQDLARFNRLPAEALYATPFGSTISAVGGRPACFLMCHNSGILRISELGARKKSPENVPEIPNSKKQETRKIYVPRTNDHFP